MPSIPNRLVPRSLFARVTLIIVVGLVAAQALTFALIRAERGVVLRELMMSNVEADIATAVALLDRLPAAERAGWLARLDRRNYRLALGGGVDGPAPQSPFGAQFAAALVDALRPFQVVRVAQAAASRDGVRIEVRLNDGAPLIVDARRVEMPVQDWALWVLAIQLALLAACAWFAVRLATRPLARLAQAADALGPDLKASALAEDGPVEVAHAARAFNAMQRRIAGYMAERVEILAAISHDLQTPITRMRLRTDLMDDAPDQQKFRQDLDAMQALVREGVAYARTLHGATEPAVRIDGDALLESMLADYADGLGPGRAVPLDGRIGQTFVTRPHALRRILANLVDNALKFGNHVRVRVQVDADVVALSVLDDGPGIPDAELEAVLKPFYRVENSRNRATGGTGLGLAIAHQLALAMGAELRLRNRAEGGLEATLRLPARTDDPG